jgi:hypothetical protein
LVARLRQHSHEVLGGRGHWFLSRSQVGSLGRRSGPGLVLQLRTARQGVRFPPGAPPRPIRTVRPSLAAGSRLASLATAPAAFIVLEVRNKPADRYARRDGAIPEAKLRVRYAAMSPGQNLFVPPFKGVDEDSVYARALTTRNVVRATGSLPGDTRYARSMRVEAKSYPRTEDGRSVDRVLAVAIG